MNNTYEYQLILKPNNHLQEKTTLIIHIPIQNLNNKNINQPQPKKQPLKETIHALEKPRASKTLNSKFLTNTTTFNSFIPETF